VISTPEELAVTRLDVHCIAICFLLTILLLSTFLSCNTIIGYANAASDMPIHIHLTWQNNEMATGITVTWQTNSETSGDIVKCDIASRSGDPSGYAHSISGSHHTYAGASGWIHDVELSKLSQNTTYYFVCGGDEGGYSGERKFKTAPANPTHLRFVVGGDSRDNPSERDKVSEAMRVFNPSFVLYLGDAVNDGSSQNLWDEWFASMDSKWVDSNGYMIPIIPCLGNHEGNATNWFQQFALPGNEQWYSLDWGNDIHIVVLNAENTLSGDQQTWLHNDLESHKNVLWKFVVMHEPPFSSVINYSNTDVRQCWVPEFDRYHVNIIFSGDAHCYERSKPINYTKSSSSPQPLYSNASMYVVSGGWGAPLYAVGNNWWTAYSSSVYSFVLVDVFPNGALNLQAKDDSGLTFDNVTLPASTSTPTPTPTPIAPTPTPSLSPSAEPKSADPEFPSWIILPLFLIVALPIAVVFFKKREH
jgi:hypothetical protein